MSLGRHISKIFSSFRPLWSDTMAVLQGSRAFDGKQTRAFPASSCALTTTREVFTAPAGERGLQMVEFAVTLPVTLLIFTGLLSFGVYLNKSIEMTNSTSLAGQYLAISRLPSPSTDDPCAIFVSAFQSVSPYLAPSTLTYSFYFNSRTTSPFTATYTGTSCSAAGTATTGMVQGGSVTVTVTYPCSLGIYSVNLLPGCMLKSQVTEIIQ